MAKIANKKPQIVKSPVRITDNKYELWYSKPACLGTINKRGIYWFTSDDMRFVSSRDALEYLLRLTESTGNRSVQKIDIPAEVTEAKESTRSQTKKEKKPVIRKPVAQAVHSKKQDSDKQQEPFNQQHPMFQQFLDWVNYVGKNRARLEGN